MKKVLLFLLLVDILLALLVYFLKGELWLLNAQIAFFSSSLIMLASMLSYQGMVKSRLKVGAVVNDGRDTLDKLEDPYDLYDESSSDKTQEEKTLEEVVKEERANLKKSRRSILQITKDARAAFSFYRLGAYLLLVLGFFYLNSNGILILTPYLLFLVVPTVIVIWILAKEESNFKTTQP